MPYQQQAATSKLLQSVGVHDEHRGLGVVCAVVGHRADEELGHGALVVLGHHNCGCVQLLRALAHDGACGRRQVAWQ